MIRMAIWFRNNLIPASIWSMACPAFFAVPLRSRFPLSPAIQSEADRPSGRRKPPRRLRALSGSLTSIAQGAFNQLDIALWPCVMALSCSMWIEPRLHSSRALRHSAHSGVTADALHYHSGCASCCRYRDDEPLNRCMDGRSLSPAI